MTKTNNLSKVMFVTMRNPFTSNKGERRVIETRKEYLEQYQNKEVSIFVLKFFFQKKHENLRYINIDFIDLLYGLLNFTFRMLPLQVAIFSSPRLIIKTRNIFNDGCFEFAHFFQLRTFLLSNKLEKTRVILEFIDSLSLNYHSRLKDGAFITRLLIYLELKRIQNFEKNFSDEQKKIFVSTIDKDYLSLANSIVVPNYVQIRRDLISTQKKYELVFSGNMNYGPNIRAVRYFLKEIFSFIRLKIPGIKLYLAGVGSENFCANQDGVYCSGEVKDMCANIAKAKIAIAPMQSGSGIQNKILEALAVGIPVISSTLAYEPIIGFAGNNRNILSADTKEEWLEAINNFLSLSNQKENIDDILDYASKFSLRNCHKDYALFS